MATQAKKRINVSVSQEEYEMLQLAARQKNKTVTTVAHQMIFEALELQEDLYFAQLAASRDTKDARFISHEEFWAEE